MNTTLLIMAAGIGSRFGTGIKQLEPVDDAGHIIMDYSITSEKRFHSGRRSWTGRERCAVHGRRPLLRKV